MAINQQRVNGGWPAAVRCLSRWPAGRVLTLALGVLVFGPIMAYAQEPTVDLGTADRFAVLAGQGVTNDGETVVNGDLGTWPNPAVTGFPPGTVNGDTHAADEVAQEAQSDLTEAYDDAAGRATTETIETELGGETLGPGVYDSESGTFEITETLTLDAQGDPDAVFIFKMAGTLVTAPDSDVVLVGGAQACNLFWQVGSSATLDTGSNFAGNILALTSIELAAGVTVDGRLLARNASVTLISDTITRATCATTFSPPIPVPTGGVETGGGSTAGVHGTALLAIGTFLLVMGLGVLALSRPGIRKGRRASPKV